MNQKKAFMFEQLLQCCENRPASISRLLGIDYNQIAFNCDEQELAGRLYEKYAGTWWEVTFEDFSDVTCDFENFSDGAGDPENFSDDAGETEPICVYLADSIQDALRLRPQTSESYWQNALKYFDELIINMYDMEEECV
jgi:hypothetical protein